MIHVVNKKYHTPTDRDIYIGRGSPLGNPFVFRELEINKLKDKRYKCHSREQSIERFEMYLNFHLEKENENDSSITKENKRAIKREMNKIYRMASNGDINLVCYCKPAKCHGDVIAKKITDKLLYTEEDKIAYFGNKNPAIYKLIEEFDLGW